MTATVAEKVPAAMDASRNMVSSSRPRIAKSIFLLALVIFGTLNLFLAFDQTFAFDPYRFNYKGWSWWTIDDLRQQKEISNIALLGSSTMVSAISTCDATFLKRGLDLAYYHKASYLEHRLQKAFPGSFETFSLAAPGQMPSDAYLSLKAMVATANRPDVVIYGVAPRDFIDSTLQAPADTDAFKYLTRLINIDDVGPMLFRNPFGKLDWFLQRHIYFYNYALDMRLFLQDVTTGIMDRILPAPGGGKAFTWWDRVRLLPAYLPAEIHAGATVSQPYDPEHPPEYKDNTLEYIARYRKPDKHTIKTQMYFLNKIAEFCRKERIELIVVNMPITLQNISLLPPGSYLTHYLTELRKFAFENNVIFYDLNNFERYNMGDFHDSVHMNANGGKKFFDDIYDVIVKDYRASVKLTLAGTQLEQHKAVAAKGGRPL